MTKRRRGSKYERVRKVTKTGNYTYYVTIPKEYIYELDWRERQNVVVSLEDDAIVIRRYRAGPSVANLLR